MGFNLCTRWTWLFFICLALLFAACDSSKTASPLVNFIGSDCKNHANSSAVKAALITTENEQYAGLICIRWELKRDEKMRIDLINFRGACGAEYKGSAQLTGSSAVTLSVDNPSCTIAKCGNCSYDWSFDLEGIDSQSDVQITIAENACPEKQESRKYAFKVTTAQINSGVVCKYSDDSWSIHYLEAGSLHALCEGASGSTVSTDTGVRSCKGDLVCAEKGSIGPTCFQPCTADGDCPQQDGLYSCKEGLCLLRTTW